MKKIKLKKLLKKVESCSKCIVINSAEFNSIFYKMWNLIDMHQLGSMRFNDRYLLRNGAICDFDRGVTYVKE